MSVSVRVQIPGRDSYHDVIVPDEGTVQDALDTCRERGFDYNGEDITILSNGRPVDEPSTYPVEDMDSILVLPDKPAGASR